MIGDLVMTTASPKSVLGLGHRPAATLELRGQLFSGHAGQRLLCRRRAWPGAGGDGRALGHLLVLKAFDERSHFVTGELASRLTLGESHGTPGIAEIGVTGVVQQGQELLHLPG